jgi:hypothetical protein
MTGHGVFAVDRGIWDHPLFRRDELTEREAFLWLVSEAAFKSRRVRVGSTLIRLERGQVAHSLRFMATKWKWKEPRVRRFLARLKSDAMIDARTDAGQTIVTICNYCKYQWPNGDADADTDAPKDAGATQERRKEEECNNDLKKEPPPSAASDRGKAAAGKTKPKCTRSLAPRAYTPAFEAFWADYPKTKTTNPKAECFDVWERLSPADQATGTASLPRFAEHCGAQWQGYQPPGAAVYLRKRRFDDFAPASPPPLDGEKHRAGLKALARAHFRGEWREQWGARPGAPGCMIPADIIAEVREESGAALQ